jgi:hypothetical protein
MEADREIYRKWITKSKQYSTTLRVLVPDYFTYRITLFITARYVTLRTPQKLTKETKISALLGRYYGVHLTPSGNKHNCGIYAGLDFPTF